MKTYSIKFLGILPHETAPREIIINLDLPEKPSPIERPNSLYQAIRNAGFIVLSIIGTLEI